MKILLLVDDLFHPGEVPEKGFVFLKDEVNIIYDALNFDFDSLSDYHVVIVSKSHKRTKEDAQGWKTQEVQDKLVKYVENGGGLLINHSATVADPENETFHQLIGCRFAYHPAPNPVTIAPVKPHPITEGVNLFTEIDEMYNLEILADDINIIAAAYAPPQGEVAKYKSEPYFNAPASISAAVYTREVGKGRICVLTPGHFPKVFANPEFIKLAKNAVKWLTKG